MMEQQKQYARCLIVGSGPAGYMTAIYAARANLNPVLYCGLRAGGQLTQTTEMENFPGYPGGVGGNQMMTDLRQQAEYYGTDIRNGEIAKADLTKALYKLVIDSGDEIQAKAVIIATGTSAKYLGLEGEERYRGQGVSACATCDGFFYRDKMVTVIGGDDTAHKEAIYLAGPCSKVYLIMRKDYLYTSDVMQQCVEESEKIEVLYKHDATGFYGESGVEGVHLAKHLSEENERHYDLPVDGFFLATGYTPDSSVFKNSLEANQAGYIKATLSTSKTKIPGVYVAGDVTDPVYHQAVVVVGAGCRAALEVERYLTEINEQSWTCAGFEPLMLYFQRVVGIRYLMFKHNGSVDRMDK